MLIALALLICTTVACAEPLYTVTSISGINPAFGASALNDSGQVVGTSFVPIAAVWDGGAVTMLGTLGGSSSTAYGINDLGQIVGGAFTSSSATFHAFVYSNGIMSDLGGCCSAIAINNSGQIAGIGPPFSAFIYSDGVMKDLGTLGGDRAYVSDINNSGQVVGLSTTSSGASRAFLYSNGTMIDLGTLGGIISSSANAINDSGQIVGEASPASGPNHAFLYSNGRMMDLGTLGGSSSAAFGINDLGQIVGRADTSSSGLSHAFVCNNGTMVDLNSLIEPSLNVALRDAWAINNVGQILADSDGNNYLLTPVPEPSTWALLSIPVLILLVWSHHRKRCTVSNSVRIMSAGMLPFVTARDHFSRLHAFGKLEARKNFWQTRC